MPDSSMQVTHLFGIVCVLHSAIGFAAPDWAKRQTQFLEGTTYKVVCSGNGPSVDLARKEAESSCKSSAISKLSVNGSVRSLTVETEHNIAFHQEILEDVSFKNLSCFPEKESIESEYSQFTVWLLCRFDLSKVVIEKKSEVNANISHAVSRGMVSNWQSLTTLKGSETIPQRPSMVANKSTLTIATVPICDNLIIRGARSRTLPCTQNPMSIVLDRNDQEIIVRAKGYRPRNIQLQLDEGRPNHEEIQIILESN